MKKRGVFVWLLMALTVAALAFLFVYLLPRTEIDTAEVVFPTPQATEPGGAGTVGGDDLQTVAVTPETVQTVLARLARTDSYSRRLTVESFWTGGSSREDISVWVHGGNTKLAVSRETGPVKYVLIKNGALWIWYSDSSRVYRGSAGDRDADEYQTLLTYEDVLALDPSCITDAGYANYGGEGCVYVRYVSGELGYESLCYVSVSTGLLTGCETYDGDRLIYRMSASETDISTPDDSVFAEP